MKVHRITYQDQAGLKWKQIRSMCRSDFGELSRDAQEEYFAKAISLLDAPTEHVEEVMEKTKKTKIEQGTWSMHQLAEFGSLALAKTKLEASPKTQNGPDKKQADAQIFYWTVHVMPTQQGCNKQI